MLFFKKKYNNLLWDSAKNLYKALSYIFNRKYTVHEDNIMQKFQDYTLKCVRLYVNIYRFIMLKI